MNRGDINVISAAIVPRGPVTAGVVGRVAWLLALVGSFTSPPLANAGAATALIAVAASPALRRRALQILRSPTVIACAAFVAWMLLSMLWSEAAWGSRFSAVFDWRTLIILPLGYVLFSEDRHKRLFAVSFATVAGIAALFILATWAIGYWPVPGYTPGLLFRNWVTQTMMFGAAALVAAALLLERSDRSADRGEIRLRVWLWVVLGALLTSIASISIGRSAVLLLVGGMLVLVFHTRVKWARWALPAMLVVGFIVAITGNTMMNRHAAVGLNELSEWKDPKAPTSGGLRVNMWLNTLELIEHRPLLGYGAGGFAPAYERLVAERYRNWRATPTTDPHNQFLRVAAEFGLIGLAFFVAVIVVAALRAARSPWRGLGRALLLGWCATSMLNSHFQTFNEGHMIFLLLGAFFAPDDDA